MEIDPTVPPYPFVQWDGKVVREIQQVRFKPGVDPDKVVFETGYDKAALASCEVFKRLRDAGAIATGTSLPGLACRRRMSSGYLYVSGPARADLFRCLRARAEDGARQHRRRRSRPATSRSSGTSARRCWPSRATSRTGRPTTRSRPSTCWAAWAMRCRPASSWAITSATARRADEHLVQPKDAAILVEMMERHRGRHPAAHRFLPYPGAQGPHRRRLLRAAQGLGSGRPAPSSISACCTTTTMRATRRASPSAKKFIRRISGCRPNAAGAAPSRGGCPDC